MIHDPQEVEVTCDGASCSEHAVDWEWLVIDGKHYCSQECVPAALRPKPSKRRTPQETQG